MFTLRTELTTLARVQDGSRNERVERVLAEFLKRHRDIAEKSDKTALAGFKWIVGSVVDETPADLSSVC